MKKRLTLLSAALIALSGAMARTAIGTEANHANACVTTHAKVNKKPYNPMIFGGFIEHFHHQVYGGIFDPGSPLADKDGFRKDVLKALKELRIPVVRWPGGCFVDGYHWVNGIGPDRKPMDDVSWGVIEPNTFGTDEFVAFCRKLGAEPYICHNSFAEVQEMADWVAYCNLKEGPWAEKRKAYGHRKPHNVKIWSVGNEQGGKAYIDHVREGAKAMKETDPEVLVTCSGTHGAGWIDPYLLETAGDYLDYISIHQYWIHNFQQHQTPDYMTCIGMSELPEQFICDVIHSLDVNHQRGRIKLAFDEWNLRSWHHPGYQRTTVSDYDDPETQRLIAQRDKSLNNKLYTMADALFSASFLNACLRHSEDVYMANVAPMVNQTGPLYVHKEGIVRRPHFYTMKMYANMLEDYVVDIEVASDAIGNEHGGIPAIDVLATTNKSEKRWVVSLVNRDPQEAKTCQLQLGDWVPQGTYRASVLSGDCADAYNDVDDPYRVVPVDQKVRIEDGAITLPPHSLTIVTIRK